MREPLAISALWFSVGGGSGVSGTSSSGSSGTSNLGERADVEPDSNTPLTVSPIEQLADWVIALETCRVSEDIRHALWPGWSMTTSELVTRRYAVGELIDAAALPRNAFDALRLVQPDDMNLAAIRQEDDAVGLARPLFVERGQRERLQVIPKNLARLVVRGRGGEVRP